MEVRLQIGQEGVGRATSEVVQMQVSESVRELGDVDVRKTLRSVHGLTIAVAALFVNHGLFAMSFLYSGSAGGINLVHRNV